MICAMLPLFTMTGPEGQIFGPMADTYAFALAGALLLALTVSPVLCSLLFRSLKPAKDNILVRGVKTIALTQMDFLLRHRRVVLTIFGAVTLATICYLPFMGREFMPELEEGNMIVRGTFPVNVSLEEAVEKAKIARNIMIKYPEVRLATSQIGRPDDGTDPTGYYNVECFVPLFAAGRMAQDRREASDERRLIQEMNEELSATWWASVGIFPR